MAEDLEAQWFLQLTQMREALEEVKRLQSHTSAGAVQVYGEDLDIGSSESSDDDELLWSDLETPQSAESDEDGSYDRVWFVEKVRNHAKKTGMEAGDLEGALVGVLKSNSSDEELQGALMDILGFDDLDFLSDLIAHREDIFKERGQYIDGKRILSPEEQAAKLEAESRLHKSAPLGPKLASEAVNYPHIYRAHDAGNTLDVFGNKYRLPPGSQTRHEKNYEEIIVPAAKVGTLGVGRRLVPIKEMDMLCQNTFRGYKSLNRMQSLVYPVAYSTNENMLICAPTGAGKTDAAMLTILNTIARYCEPNPLENKTAAEFYCRREEFKIVYVAPMKALAAEVVEKLGKRLAWLGIEVRELTGDMHLTKAEVVRTQIIVTTPEKWDVVTRKSTGDTELVQKVRLLIIDEVHMLHDERGAVLESLVARTQRQVESTQTMIRIVGLSATLPNYIDVASFLRVNPYAGLFYFDASFRPVPLEQHFLGVKGKPGTKISNDNIDRTAYEKVKEMLELGHQVMVFVHSRKDTVKTARTFYQLAMEDESVDLFSNEMHEDYNRGKKDMDRSKLKELRDLYQKGFAVHHAGMLRSDRNLVERLFSEGLVKVLCCTATLAWGVNLPAAAVVIKGTQIYNPEKGSFVDLGILDVLQIFGRAGRPQFQDTGIGFIVTTHDKQAHYLSAVTQQQPIESQFASRLVDNLNAEVSLGTVTNVHEAVQWLGYSYMCVRWKKNPLYYGINWNTLIDDPHLVQRRREMIITAAKKLHANKMINFFEETETLAPKDIGRIASDYYILYQSIEIFNKLLKPRATEADIFAMVSLSDEFKNIQARDSEFKELDRLRNDYCPCNIPGKAEANQQKTNILLQAYVSQATIDDFALISDINYVAQNAARICRALFQIAIIRRWGHLASVLLAMCKSVERKLWPYQHPLAQFDQIPQHIINKLEERETVSHIESLRDMEPGEIGDLVNNKTYGPKIANLLEFFPTLQIDTEIAPLNKEVLHMKLFITPEFKWSDRIHGAQENYWIWVENSDTQEILHSQFFMLSKKKFRNDHEMAFAIPLSDPLPTQIYVRAISDRWLGAETVNPVSFQHLIRPDTEVVYTELLNVPRVPITELENPTLEEIYGKKFTHFNAMQSQLFPYLYHEPGNVLLGSPTGSGKTVACELAMWRAFREMPRSKVVYIAPMKALVRERVNDWTEKFSGPTRKKVVELTGDNTPDTRSIQNADIIITTPEKWDGISRSWQSRDYVRQVSLVIIDEIHLLGGDRGPILEIIVSRLNFIASQTKKPVRIMGMSTCSANAQDLGDWLGVKEGLFNFKHSTRPVPLDIYFEGFPEIRGFCPLMQSMNRPTFLAIKAHSPEKPVIVFVASRRQTRLTARDLIAFCGMEDDPRRFLKVPEEDLPGLLSRVKDDSLKEALQFGIGLHHAGLVESDRQMVEELFLHNRIQILVATATLAWGVNLPAHLVIVKGTQFYDAKLEGYKDMDLTDVMQMLGRAGRPQFDTSGVACVFTQESKKPFYQYFLQTGFPVESSLHKVLDDHLGAEITAGTVKNREDAREYLTWTFLYRRLPKNPTYYGLKITPEEMESLEAERMVEDELERLADTSVAELQKSGCVTVDNEGNFTSTELGRICSYYYISHKTVRHIAKHAKRQATLEDCLTWMCSATEYDELPVRHNEDQVNVELAAQLPLEARKMAHLPMWDPHIKAFLLLQAFLNRNELPTDYFTDQNSVLDQSIRIIQASIEILLELGYLSSILRMIQLLQCIKQACWPEAPPLSILPGVDAKHIPKKLKDFKLESLTDLPNNHLEKILTQVGVPSPSVQKAKSIARTLPNLTVSSSIENSKLMVSVTRNTSPPNSDFRIWAPKFPKSQTEGWFVLLGDEGRDVIYGLKRMGWNPGSKKGVTSKTSINIPDGVTTENLKVWVISDGYKMEYKGDVGETFGGVDKKAMEEDA